MTEGSALKEFVNKWSKLALIIGLIGWAIGIICCIAQFVFLANGSSSV